MVELSTFVLISTRSRAEGLLGQYGAETFTQYQEAQQEFVRREMNVNIRFLNSLTSPDHERINAVTQELIEGTHVVFGLSRHWVALDGIRKYGRNRGWATWTGMDPAGGKRIESERRSQLSPQLIIDRLLEGDMPIIKIEGIELRRWPGRSEEIFQNPRRIRRVEETPLFRPLGRRIKRAQE